MCGICGIVNFSGIPIERHILAAMTQTLQHRGPDDDGVLVMGPAGFGHTRLSIIDLSMAGHQPMQSEDGLVTLTYNGEVYNFRELRRILEREGVAFHSQSDTEVILHAYLRWGCKAFQRFNGMFALAIWDARSNELHLARDRFGIKPLYYSLLPSGLVFGSEIKALLASGKVSREINLAGLHEYLYYGNALGDSTLYNQVYKLLPGHYFSISRVGYGLTPYWRVENVEPVGDSLNQATVSIRERLEQAIQSHLISDVPVGVFLSGGIDSSCITAFASKHYKGRLQTFSVGFDFDHGSSELEKARQVAEYFGTDHQELHIEGGSLSNLIERMVRCHDEPFGDAANIPLYLLCQKLAGSPKVILQGDGGDEMFAGYRRYNILTATQFWRCFARLGYIASSIISWEPNLYRWARFFYAVQQRDPAMRMALLLTQETPAEPPTRILSLHWRNILASYDPFVCYHEYNRRLGHLDLVQRMLHTDTSVILPNTFLEKVDKATMAHGIEVRVPLLDHQLTDYVMGLPASYKVRHGQKKWLLRKALRGVLPDTILDAPKTGFSVPYAYWLRKPLAGYLQSILLDPVMIGHNLFDQKILQVCIKEHISGRRNHGFLLWKALHLALWYQEYAIKS